MSYHGIDTNLATKSNPPCSAIWKNKIFIYTSNIYHKHYIYLVINIPADVLALESDVSHVFLKVSPTSK